MSEEFDEKKYTFCKNALDENLVNFIKEYFIFNEIRFPGEIDMQVPSAYSRYADPMTESLLIKLKGKIEENTGLELIPTYSYYRLYRTGDILFPHIDRPACEISATLCLGYSYDDKKYSWPIFVSGKGYKLKPGDMAIYRGLECPHWRNKFLPPSSGDYQIQTFLHYVDKNGPYAEWKYDKRSGIGYAKKNIQ